MTPIVMERMPPKLSQARTTAPSITFFLQKRSQLGHLIQSQCVTWEPLNSHKHSAREMNMLDPKDRQSLSNHMMSWVLTALVFLVLSSCQTRRDWEIRKAWFKVLATAQLICPQFHCQSPAHSLSGWSGCLYLASALRVLEESKKSEKDLYRVSLTDC